MHRPKHFEVGTTNGTTSGSQVELFNYELTESMNVHGLRGDLCLGTPTAPAYIEIRWALLCQPDIVGTSAVALSNTVFNDDSVQALVWASGCALVDDNQIYERTIELGTSRNCEKGSRIILVARFESTLSGTSPTLNTVFHFQWWETQT